MITDIPELWYQLKLAAFSLPSLKRRAYQYRNGIRQRKIAFVNQERGAKSVRRIARRG